MPEIERPKPKTQTLPVALGVVALLGWGTAAYVYSSEKQQERSLSDQLVEHTKAEGTLTDLNGKISAQQAALDKAMHDLGDAGEQQKTLQAQAEGTRSQLADLSDQRDGTQAALVAAQQGLGEAQKQTQALAQQQAENLKQAQADGLQAEQTLSEGRDAVAAAMKTLGDAQDRHKAAQQKLDQAKATILQANADRTRLQADAQDADQRATELPSAIAILVAKASERDGELSDLQQQLQAAQQQADATQADLGKAQQTVELSRPGAAGGQGCPRQASG